MKVEDTLAQIKFWEMLNQVMRYNDVSSIKIHGFMADEAMANWKAINRCMERVNLNHCMEEKEHVYSISRIV
eukprot:c8922_g1_i1 orf=115-330(-)